VWNGDLVIWNHGFDLDPPGPVTHAGLGPLVDVQLAEGYAVAASSYRLNGWALASTNTDLKNLYDVFKRQVGTPSQVIVTGGSLGGIVTIQAVEQGNIGTSPARTRSAARLLVAATGTARSTSPGLRRRLWQRPRRGDPRRGRGTAEGLHVHACAARRGAQRLLLADTPRACSASGSSSR